MSAKNPNDFTVLELKEKLKTRGLQTAGPKNDLISRLMEADPEGIWLRESGDVQDTRCNGETSSVEASETTEARVAEVSRREMELIIREKELLERELAIARREVEFLRERRVSEAAGRGLEIETETRRAEARRATNPTGATEVTTRASITAIAELLSHFDGVNDSYEMWEKQVRLLATTYKLQDDFTKILIGSRLKGKAAEWFRSKPEYIETPTDDLLRAMKSMFDHRPNKLTRKKEFEERIWKKGETFSTYMHDKVILANRVPIEEEDIIDYIVDGISDLNLQNQARIQGFATTESLLKAFEKITFRPKGQQDGVAATRPRGGAKQQKDGEGVQNHGRRCYNCGGRNHLSADCPNKEKGIKCFKCGEHGHIAAKCVGKGSDVRGSCAVSEYRDEKYYKNVYINNRCVIAMLDTGSDICLMREDCYARLNVPSLKENKTCFHGIGSSKNETLGEFDANIYIDDNSFSIKIRVISNNLMRHDLIIGADFLRTVEVVIKNGEMIISKLEEKKDLELPEIFQIDCAHETDRLDLIHVNNDCKIKLEDMIENYKPNKTRDIDVKMKLILKDDEPIYQRARRLSEQEKQIVRRQVDEWMRDDIVRPSLSEYASPVVLVRKKSGTYRLCVDYRQLNRKIVKDRYPLPLIDDQLDRLQSAKVFTTLDLENGFFHVKVDEDSRKFTAFIIPDGDFRLG